MRKNKYYEKFIILLMTMVLGWNTISCTEDGDDDSGGITGGVSPYGSWVRGNNVNSYLHFEGSTAIACVGGVPTTGTFNAAVPSMTFVVGGETIVFPLQFNSNNTLLMGVPDQAINTNTATLYYRSDTFPCDDNGNGGGTGSTTGNVAFWTQSDLGCGPVSVSIAGQTGTITGYYQSGSPGCGAQFNANFTLAPGNYSYTASCGSYNWEGSVTISAGQCSTMRLQI